jgi:DNA-binding PadR family transcriptional regulator
MKTKPTRLTTTSYAVLSLVEMLGEATPYDLKRFLEKSIANFWAIPHTTFYAEAQRLALAGHLSERQERGGRRRKLYTLTERGREVLAAWKRSPALAPPQLHEEGVLKIFAGANPDRILRERRAWHAAKLAELEGCLEEVRAAPAELAGPERSLIVGVGYHRALVAETERALGELARAADDEAAAARAAPSS